MFYQFFVLKGYSQFLGDDVSDGAATAAKLTADRNDFIRHKNTSLLCWFDYIIFTAKCQKLLHESR